MRYFVFLLGFMLALLTSVADPTTNTITLQGRVVPASGSNTNLNFKTDSGTIYKILRTAQSEALFLDTNLHTKILLVKGKVPPEQRAFEVTGNLHSLKGGKVNELYYYCDICSIKSSIPGPCQCCRQPVRLVEEPVK